MYKLVQKHIRFCVTTRLLIHLFFLYTFESRNQPQQEQHSTAVAASALQGQSGNQPEQDQEQDYSFDHLREPGKGRDELEEDVRPVFGKDLGGLSAVSMLAANKNEFIPNHMHGEPFSKEVSGVMQPSEAVPADASTLAPRPLQRQVTGDATQHQEMFNKFPRDEERWHETDMPGDFSDLNFSSPEEEAAFYAELEKLFENPGFEGSEYQGF